MLPSESFNVKLQPTEQLSRSFSLRDDDRLFPPDGTTNAARGLG